MQSIPPCRVWGCCYSWPKSSSTALMIVTVPGCMDWPWRSSSCTSRGKHGASCVHSWAACRHPSEENQPQAQQTPHQIQRALIAGSYRWDKAMWGGRGNLTLEATWICFQFLMMLKAKDNLTVENVYKELGLWQHMSTVATTTVSVDHTRNMKWTMFIPHHLLASVFWSFWQTELFQNHPFWVLQRHSFVLQWK